MSLWRAIINGVEKIADGAAKEAFTLEPVHLNILSQTKVAPMLTELDKKLLPHIDLFDSALEKK